MAGAREWARGVVAKLDRPVAVAAVILAAAVVLAAALIVASGGEVSRLVNAGPPWTQPSEALPSLAINDTGFDGQFYYRLAVAPWSAAADVEGVTFDLPPLRYSRILYPLLAWAVSMGDPDLVPWALLVVNVVALALLGWLGASLAQDTGIRPLWGMLFPLFPGFVYSLSLDLAEIVTAACVTAALLALRKERPAAAALLLCLGVLARETSAVVPLAIVAAWTWQRIRGEAGGQRASLAAGLVPLAVLGTWQVLVGWRFGELPVAASGENNLSWPFRGLVSVLDGVLPPSSGEAVFRFLSAALLVAVIVLAGRLLRSSTAPLHERIGWVLAVGVLFLAGDFVWEGATSFMRAGTEAYLLSVTVIFSSRRRLSEWVAVPVLGTWGLTAAAQVAKA